MADNDFGTLTDKDFEALCADLLGVTFGTRFERFRPGKDQGVDGRYFLDGTHEVVLQCKHWRTATTKDLLRHIVSKEAPKVHRLNPARYILAVSTPLSRRDKEHLREALSPHLRSPSDIFGREDLNDLIRNYPLVERRHYKLWMTTASALSHIFNRATLERSAFTLSELIADAGRYVRTTSHDAARKLADLHRVVIVAGEPGIGKTTLAGQLSLEYATEGFDFILVSESLDDADRLFEKDAKQIFLFDDFLGRNYLEALSGHEGSRITHFIRRIRKDPNKRFILTSRSTIWNRGRYLIDLFDVEHLAKHELTITIQDLTDFDKARILYNHLWHSSLPPEYREEIYKSRRYRDIIDHQNFNPRLIQFVTDFDRLASVPADQYWEHLSSLMDNPADVWENPFAAQQSDLGRALVVLVTIQGRDISETDLAEAFQRFATASSPPLNSGDFVGLLKQLTGSLLSRELRPNGPALINLFNPSLGDYVLRRYSADVGTLVSSTLALRSVEALHTIRSLRKNDLLGKDALDTVLRGVMKGVASDGFRACDADFLSRLVVLVIGKRPLQTATLNDVRAAALYLQTDPLPNDVTSLAIVYQFAISRTWTSVDVAFRFIDRALAETPRDEEELKTLTTLFANLPDTAEQRAEIQAALKSSVLDMVTDILPSSIDDNDVLADVDYEDYSRAESLVEEYIRDKLDEYPALVFPRWHVDDIASSYDARAALDKRFEDAGRDYERRISPPAHATRIDDIDDLFDRS